MSMLSEMLATVYFGKRELRQNNYNKSPEEVIHIIAFNLLAGGWEVFSNHGELLYRSSSILISQLRGNLFRILNESGGIIPDSAQESIIDIFNCSKCSDEDCLGITAEEAHFAALNAKSRGKSLIHHELHGIKTEECINMNSLFNRRSEYILLSQCNVTHKQNWHKCVANLAESKNEYSIRFVETWIIDVVVCCH